MTLLRPRTKNKKSRLRAYVTISCPFNGHQVGPCRGLCEPIGEYGVCGRLAPHLMKGRTQVAIEAYNAAQTLPV